MVAKKPSTVVKRPAIGAPTEVPKLAPHLALACSKPGCQSWVWIWKTGTMNRCQLCGQSWFQSYLDHGCQIRSKDEAKGHTVPKVPEHPELPDANKAMKAMKTMQKTGSSTMKAMKVTKTMKANKETKSRKTHQDKAK